jgi:hypothetical protein
MMGHQAQIGKLTSSTIQQSRTFWERAIAVTSPLETGRSGQVLGYGGGIKLLWMGLGDEGVATIKQHFTDSRF